MKKRGKKIIETIINVLGGIGIILGVIGIIMLLARILSQ